MDNVGCPFVCISRGKELKGRAVVTLENGEEIEAKLFMNYKGDVNFIISAPKNLPVKFYPLGPEQAYKLKERLRKGRG